MKTAPYKEMAPYDPDWYYVRAGAQPALISRGSGWIKPSSSGVMQKLPTKITKLRILRAKKKKNCRQGLLADFCTHATPQACTTRRAHEGFVEAVYNVIPK